MSIEIVDESGAGIDLDAVTSLATHVYEQMRIHAEADVYVRFVETGPMEELHLEWMDLAGPTDVMSFPMDELRPGDDAEPGVLGDIVVCSEVAAQRPCGGAQHDGRGPAPRHPRPAPPHGLRPRGRRVEG